MCSIIRYVAALRNDMSKFMFVHPGRHNHVMNLAWLYGSENMLIVFWSEKHECVFLKLSNLSKIIFCMAGILNPILKSICMCLGFLLAS